MVDTVAPVPDPDHEGRWRFEGEDEHGVVWRLVIGYDQVRRPMVYSLHRRS